MKVTIVKDSHGQENVHAAGCADLKKRSKGYRMSEAWTADFADLRELYASYWDCIADEAVANDPETYPTLEHVWYAWQAEFDVHPCASALAEMPEPGSVEPEPKWEIPAVLVVSAKDAAAATALVRQALEAAGIEVKSR